MNHIFSELKCTWSSVSPTFGFCCRTFGI